MRIVAVCLLGFTFGFLLCTGCAIKKPVQWAYKPILGVYCVQRNASGTQCLRWAPKVSYACVNDPATGDCTPATK